jgi:hypothetical protein
MTVIYNDILERWSLMDEWVGLWFKLCIFIYKKKVVNSYCIVRGFEWETNYNLFFTYYYHNKVNE